MVSDLQKTSMAVRVGDKVQIKPGAIDVTNGNRAVEGKLYGVGGPLWATVIFIDENYEPNSRYGLPEKITRVICQSDTEVIVWQVQPDGIGRIIRQHDLGSILDGSGNRIGNTEDLTGYKHIMTGTGFIDNADVGDLSDNFDVTNNSSGAYNNSDIGYVPIVRNGRNDSGIKSSSSEGKVYSGSAPSDKYPENIKMFTQDIGPKTSMGDKENVLYYTPEVQWRELNEREKKSIGNPDIVIDESAIRGSTQKTAFENPNKRREILSEDTENIINSEGFPYQTSKSSGLVAARYDYQITPNDTRYDRSKNLEDRLQQARALLGIQVHGSNEIARAVKYYLYNRFKVPDTNMAHNRSITHVFFTRPDLNILTTAYTGSVRANWQVLNHTESSMLWNMHPDLFKLLVDSIRCGDVDNFNMLLSNQVRSFDIIDEQLNFKEVGKAWNEHTMSYGYNYTGRLGGEFSCTFSETEDYSIINLMRLWITYIDKVSNGSWKPSYNLERNDGSVKHNYPNDSHVYTKTLDYAASAYVFKCRPDGEDVIYWTKYCGIFPLNTGENILSWDSNDGGIDISNPTIKFRYCYKVPFSPISLIEFNDNARITSYASYESSFNQNFNHSSRPFVGTPFIEITDGDGGSVGASGVNFAKRNAHVRLKFKKAEAKDPRLTDDILYRYNMSKNVKTGTIKK